MHAEAGKERIIWSNVVAIALSWAIWIPFMTATYYYEQVFLSELGASPFIIAFISFTSMIILSFSRLLGGYLADSYGRTIWIKIMTFAIAASYLIYALAPSWEWYLIGVVIGNIALFYQPAISAVLSDSIPQRLRGRGINAVHLLERIVGLASPVLAIYFISGMGLVPGQRMLYTLAFIAGIVAGLIRLFLLRETVQRREEALKISVREFMKQYLKTGRTLVEFSGSFLLYIILLSLTLGMRVLAQLYALKYLQVTYYTWAKLMLINSAVSIIFLIPSGIIVDKLGRRKAAVMNSVIALTTSSLLFMATPENAGFLLLLWAVIQGTQSSMMAGVNFAIISDSLPKDMRAKGFAATLLLAGISRSWAMLLSGWVYENLGPKAPFGIATALSAATFIASLWVKETLNAEKSSSHLSP